MRIKYNKSLIVGLLITSFLSGCSTSNISFYSTSNPSYWSPYFDFNPVFGKQRKLSEFYILRTYHVGEESNFDGTLLNPRNYEDDGEVPFYRSSELSDSSSSHMPIDYSDEVIEFMGHDATLANLIATYNVGALSPVQIDDLLNNLATNDDIVNFEEIDFTETIYYHDFFSGPYYAYNNYHKIENVQSSRYDNQIVHGTGTGTIYYQDGFVDEYSLVEQIRSDGYFIYEMRDETYPDTSNRETDYKRVSPRTDGNFKDALRLGGGGRALRWLDKRAENYGPYIDGTKPGYQNFYALSLTATKTTISTNITYHLQVSQHIGENNTAVYNMDLLYIVTITNGIVSSIEQLQTYSVNLA